MVYLTDERSEGVLEMSKQQIQMEATKLFAQHGYEGTSMQLVAEAVGIKKQSIYTHYKNKDALFLAVCEQAMEQELEQTQQTLQQITAIDGLQQYLQQTIERYEQSARTRFWLRMSIYPPMHLQEQVLVYVYHYLDAIEHEVHNLLQRYNEQLAAQISIPLAASAFLGILDACQIELIYGGPARVAKRLYASWEIYARGVFK